MADRFGKLAWLWLSLVVIAVDQISKHWFVANFNLYEQMVVIPDMFSWTLAYNRGAAFSFLANETGWQRWFFAVIALVGFGTFSVGERPAREGINPLTKEKIQIAAKKVAKFKAGAELADALN